MQGYSRTISDMYSILDCFTPELVSPIDQLFSLLLIQTVCKHVGIGKVLDLDIMQIINQNMSLNEGIPIWPLNQEIIISRYTQELAT